MVIICVIRKICTTSAVENLKSKKIFNDVWRINANAYEKGSNRTFDTYSVIQTSFAPHW